MHKRIETIFFLGGSGKHGNAVFPQPHGKTCAEVCASTFYKICDAEVAIIGYPKRAKTSKTVVGMFYNYGCDKRLRENNIHDETKSTDKTIVAIRDYNSFCCCRYL